MEKDESLWVIIVLREQLFAVPVWSVHAITQLTSVTKLPQAPDHIRGVMDLRGKTIPLIDLRRKLGLPSQQSDLDSFCQMMTQREEDHKKWLAQLNASVLEQREFSLTTDPHKCAFGKWYDTYKTTNTAVTKLLISFDAPHKRIHQLGEQVKALMQEHKTAAALALVEQCKSTTLAEMIRLFANLRETYLQELKEIAVVVQLKEKNFALAVDAVSSISKLLETDIGNLADVTGGMSNADFVQGVAKSEDKKQLVLLLDINKLHE